MQESFVDKGKIYAIAKCVILILSNVNTSAGVNLNMNRNENNRSLHLPAAELGSHTTGKVNPP